MAAIARFALRRDRAMIKNKGIKTSKKERERELSVSQSHKGVSVNTNMQ